VKLFAVISILHVETNQVKLEPKMAELFNDNLRRLSHTGGTSNIDTSSAVGEDQHLAETLSCLLILREVLRPAILLDARTVKGL